MKETIDLNKEGFKKELEKHNLTVNGFLDLHDAWNRLRAGERLELLKEEEH